MPRRDGQGHKRTGTVAYPGLARQGLFTGLGFPPPASTLAQAGFLLYRSAMWVTLTTVQWITEADLVCARLESEGIRSFIPDQGTVIMNPLYATAIGGIRVQVDEADLDRARALLGEESPPAVASGITACPACGSDQTHYENVSRRFAFLSLALLGIPLLWVKHQWTCEACGHRWKAR
ncbi:MAG: DUF2007 domain-containing protein [Verrucomicrobia bacterium]|nr:DUF2007 domain-containing protein [Kiritimatiellia bacterium]MCB1103075.1 DUF2007 domain-containing protein [Kiritimatiellia bacterium]MCP5488108.1 DUF2007 domain-containing protein [Verrucomicrobiota bacterium]